MIAAIYVLASDNSPFAVVLERLTSSKDLSDITTNRSDLFVAYWRAITKNVGTLLFGYGFNAPLLNGRGAHNVFLELAYYIGIVGLTLIIGLMVSLVCWIGNHTSGFHKQSMIEKYVALGMAMVVYCSRQGMFLLPCYAAFFLALLSLHIVKKRAG